MKKVVSSGRAAAIVRTEKMYRKTILATFALFAVAAGLGTIYSEAKGTRARVSAPAALNAGEKVPDFDFVDLDGKAHKFSEFKGKVVLIDFWATWCGPCLADIPKLKKLRETYGGEKFDILGMNAETIGDEDSSDPEFAKSSVARAKQVVKVRGVTWLQANAETSLPVATKVFGVKTLPAKILINGEGEVIARIGEKDDVEKVVAGLIGTN